jgi:adenosylcobinamide-GDP ribazoletransferase
VHELRLILIAVQFLTRIPVPPSVGFAPEWLNQSARHFPAVGLGVGLVAAGVLWATSLLWPLPVAAGLSMVVTLVLTGGFHEDGLADTFDALGGSVSRARALEIMKDSRIGSYGALALLMVLGLKAAALSVMPVALSLAALLLGHTASRAAAVVLMGALPYAGDAQHAKAKPLAQQVSARSVVTALAWLAVVCGALAWVWPAQQRQLGLSLLCLAIGTGCMGRWVHHRLGGYTGDTLGATQQITELLVFLSWSMKDVFS